MHYKSAPNSLGFSPIVLIVVVAIVSIGILLIITKGSFKLSIGGQIGNVETISARPSLTNAKVCTNLNFEDLCESDSVITPTQKILYVSAEVKNFSRGTDISIEWRYKDGNLSIATTNVTIQKDNANSINSSLTRRADAPPMPDGNYEVIFKSSSSEVLLNKQFIVR